MMPVSNLRLYMDWLGCSPCLGCKELWLVAIRASGPTASKSKWYHCSIILCLKFPYWCLSNCCTYSLGLSVTILASAAAAGEASQVLRWQNYIPPKVHILIYATEAHSQCNTSVGRHWGECSCSRGSENIIAIANNILPTGSIQARGQPWYTLPVMGSWNWGTLHPLQGKPVKYCYCKILFSLKCAYWCLGNGSKGSLQQSVSIEPAANEAELWYARILIDPKVCIFIPIGALRRSMHSYLA